MGFLARSSCLMAAAVAGLVGGGAVRADPDFVTREQYRPLAASEPRAALEPADDVVFAKDSAVILPAAEVQLDAAASWMRAHPAYRLVIEGRADSSGAADHNEWLAQRRTDKVRERLIASGVEADRIIVAVYGETGATTPANPLERRVIMFASQAPRDRLIAEELDRHALETSWTEHGAVYRQSRGITPTAAPVVPQVSLR